MVLFLAATAQSEPSPPVRGPSDCARSPELEAAFRTGAPGTTRPAGPMPQFWAWSCPDGAVVATFDDALTADPGTTIKRMGIASGQFLDGYRRQACGASCPPWGADPNFHLQMEVVDEVQPIVGVAFTYDLPAGHAEGWVFVGSLPGDRVRLTSCHGPVGVAAACRARAVALIGTTQIR
jgi:hypothetical protein